MVFFDDDRGNERSVAKLGVTFVLVDRRTGLNEATLMQGLRKHELAVRSRKQLKAYVDSSPKKQSQGIAESTSQELRTPKQLSAETVVVQSTEWACKWCTILNKGNKRVCELCWHDRGVKR
jgi:Acid Phosphatase